MQAAIAPLARLWRRPASTAVDRKVDSAEQAAERHYRNGLVKMRQGDFDGALAEFNRALDRFPDLADAALARAELLDGQGRGDAARGDYEKVRRLRSQMPAGAPDRRYLFRRHGHFAFEIESYDLVRNNVRNRILPHLAHGNALLIRGRASEALDSYERALKVKPNLPEILALKGEALSALGRYEEAIQAFDTVLAALPADTETLNSRGIARMALGRVGEANDDWRRQLELLSPAQSAARACVAMRQGNYGAAFHEFELARTKEPANPYWLLYRLTAGRLAGVLGATRRRFRWRPLAGRADRLSGGPSDGGGAVRPSQHALPGRGSTVPDGRPRLCCQPGGRLPSLAGSRRWRGAVADRICRCPQ